MCFSFPLLHRGLLFSRTLALVLTTPTSTCGLAGVELGGQHFDKRCPLSAWRVVEVEEEQKKNKEGEDKKDDQVREKARWGKMRATRSKRWSVAASKHLFIACKSVLIASKTTRSRPPSPRTLPPSLRSYVFFPFLFHPVLFHPSPAPTRSSLSSSSTSSSHLFLLRCRVAQNRQDN